MEPLTIAVIGSDKGLDSSNQLAERLGIAIAKKGFQVVTGAGQGLPLVAAKSAKKAGAKVFGISPWEFASEHRKKQPDQEGVFDFISYTGFGIKGRNVILIRSADAVAMVGGAMGTLNEFTVAFDEGKIIGVLEGSGGSSDVVRNIAPLGRDKGARIVYSREPEELVDQIYAMLNDSRT